MFEGRKRGKLMWQRILGRQIQGQEDKFQPAFGDDLK